MNAFGKLDWFEPDREMLTKYDPETVWGQRGYALMTYTLPPLFADDSPEVKWFLAKRPNSLAFKDITHITTSTNDGEAARTLYGLLTSGFLT